MNEIDINALGGLLVDGLDDDEARIQAELLDWLPLPGERLFEETLDAAHVDPLGYSSGTSRSSIGRFELYCDAFREAGDRLVNSCSGIPGDDALIYPIITVYRHHLELAVKGVIYACPTSLSPLTKEDIAEKKRRLTRMHSLKDLWQMLRSIDPKCDGWAAPDTAMAFQAMIIEFDMHDRDGQAGRYSHFTDGSQTLIGLRGIDLQVLKNRVHKMSHYLSAIFEATYQRDEWRSEEESW